MRGKIPLWVLPLVLATATTMPAIRAADFRVENRVFVGTDEEPTVLSSTIFHRGVVYDFLNEPEEVILFDPALDRIILLDVGRKLQTRLNTATVRQAIDRLKHLNAESKDAETRFLYNPVFKQTVDEETQDLVFDGEWLTYRVASAAVDDAEIVRQYRQFSDWSARLNTFLQPGSRPPFARMMVNEALEKRGAIPSRILLVLKRRRGLAFRREQLRSEHHLIKRLVESDRHRVVQAGEQMASFKSVSYAEYEARPQPEK
ncbi:MAG: hypothetical protein JW888_01325 [Pirellulales bacterium]|nr:hypothetical protein [Pirellulales bacterium]